MDNTPYVICIDDEKIVLNSLGAQLVRNLGAEFQYEFAESGEEGKNLISKLVDEGQKIQAVICDWLMPGLKGDQLLHWVAEKLPDCRRILLTGHMENDTVKMLESSNTDGITCVYKPWDEKEIVDLIKVTVDK